MFVLFLFYSSIGGYGRLVIVPIGLVRRDI